TASNGQGSGNTWFGGGQILFKDLNNKTNTIDVASFITETVYSVKLKICDKTNAHPRQQRLTFATKQLDDDANLSSYDIKHESTIFLSLKLIGGTRNSKFKECQGTSFDEDDSSSEVGNSSSSDKSSSPKRTINSNFNEETLLSESDSDGDDYCSRGVKRDFGTAGIDSSGDEAGNLYEKGYGNCKSPNGKVFDIRQLYKNVVFKKKSTIIPNLNKNKFICGDFFGCDDIVGSVVVGALVLCDVYSWSSDSDNNELYFLVKDVRNQIQRICPRNDNIDDDEYFNNLSNKLNFRIAVVSGNYSEETISVKSYGNQDLQCYVYVVRQEWAKNSSTYRAVLSRGYKDGKSDVVAKPMKSLVKPMSLKDFVISKYDGNLWSLYGDDDYRKAEVASLGPKEYIDEFSHRKFLIKSFLEVKDLQDCRANDCKAILIWDLVENYDVDESYKEGLLSAYEILEKEFEDYKNTVGKEMGKQKSRNAKKLSKSKNDNYNNNNNNNNNNISNGNSSGDDSMKCRRMGIEKTISDPKNLSKIAVASKWVAEVSSAASDLLNLIVSLIANSNVEENSANCITKLFPKFDPQKDKPGCLLTEKFLRALLSAVSSERKSNKEFPIIAKAVGLVYFDEAGGIPNGPKKARTRLCQSESCELVRSILLSYVAKEMLVSVNNWYNVGQIQHQTAFFKQNFNLPNKVATVFQKRVGTSQQAYANDICLAYSISLATQIRHIKHRIIEKQN
ncbi:MAG: ubiquitin family protein, partial [Nitrospinaceae bacterium]